MCIWTAMGEGLAAQVSARCLECQFHGGCAATDNDFGPEEPRAFLQISHLLYLLLEKVKVWVFFANMDSDKESFFWRLTSWRCGSSCDNSSLCPCLRFSQKYRINTRNEVSTGCCCSGVCY